MELDFDKLSADVVVIAVHWLQGDVWLVYQFLYIWLQILFHLLLLSFIASHFY
jgi:hypothetical protein